MKREFSFNYGEEELIFSADKNTIYQLDEGVTVGVTVKEYKDLDAAWWVLNFENNSGTASKVISNICDSDTLLPFENLTTVQNGCLPVEGDACVITMNGMVDGMKYWENDNVSATEYNFNYEYLDKASNKTKTFCNIGNRSSEGMMPFFDVTAKGEGYIAAIGWTGGWKASFEKKTDGILIKTGLQETSFYLEAGEKLRTSSVLIMKYSSCEDKYNKWRKLIRNYFSHKSCTKCEREGLMAFELWGGLNSENMKKRIAELKAHDIKFEDIWIDAGWYGQCTNCDDVFGGDWYSHTGDWEVNKIAHPEEFTDVSKCAKDAGMKLMLWFEPERALKGTKIYENHPEWFITLDNDNSVILNYGNEQAKNYVFELLSDYVERLDLSCYRQDFNTQLTSYFKKNDSENRIGITEIKHITGMYEIWDKLLEKHPDLIIDNCASGGRRIDIETMKLSIPFFRSDYQCNVNANPEVLQTHNANSCCYLPYVGCSLKIKDDTYAIRSSYASSWGVMFYSTIFKSMTEQDFEWAKNVSDEYRAIRKYFSMDFYNLGSNKFDETSWAIWQYNDPETNSGIVMAFRRGESPFEQVNVKLKGLDDDKIYCYENLDSGAKFEYFNTLTINLPQKRSSVIIKYKAK